MMTAPPLFEVRNLGFDYGDGAVIRDVDLCFSPGRFYGILGPNGCGKTTLLDLLVGHRSPEAGQVLFKGKSLDRISPKDRARSIALVSQNFYIDFPYTVAQVVMMGRHPHIPRFAAPGEEDICRVDEVMAATGVDRLKNARITELSGGERQRTVFARALAQDTEVLVLDEATSNLDINHSMALLDRVREGVDQRGVLVVSVFQDINLAALYCDELIYMDTGGIRASGPVEEMMDPALLKGVFGVDSWVRRDEFSGAPQASFKPGGGGP